MTDDPMRYRLLGTGGLRVSELFLGPMTFGEQGGVGAPIDECRRMVDAYADAGGNVVDTAINYRGGASETIVGELLEGRRDRFVVSTKYSVSTACFHPTRSSASTTPPGSKSASQPTSSLKPVHGSWATPADASTGESLR